MELFLYFFVLYIGKCKRGIFMEPYIEKWNKYKTYRFLKKNHEQNKKETLILNYPVVRGDDQVEEIDLNAEKDSVFEDQVCDRLVLRQALEILSPLERKIVILSKVRGCNQAEIAKMLRISQSKVSKTMKKALKKLRDKRKG